MACDFVFHNALPTAFPLSLVVYLSWFRHVTLDLSFDLVPRGIQRSEDLMDFNLNEHPL